MKFQEVVDLQAEKAVRENIERILLSIKEGGFVVRTSESEAQTPEDVRKDAKDRAIRTLAQQFLIDIVVALVIAVGPVLGAFNGDKAQWQAIGLLLMKTIFSVVISYVTRLYIAPKAPEQISLPEARG